MTTPTNKTKTPITTAAIVSERDAGRKQITDLASSIQADAIDGRARWTAYEQNPLSLDREAAKSLYHELLALEPMAAAFSPRMVDYQLRAFDEKFFAEHKDVCVLAFNSELDAVTEPLPAFWERLIKWGQDVIAQIHSPSTTAEEREKMLEERDRREAAAEALVSNICFAKAAIARFDSAPTATHFGECRGAISNVKLS